MTITKLANKFVDREVLRLFQANPPDRGEVSRNPVTGGGYIGGDDPIGEQMDLACRALRVRQWHAETGLDDVQPLPISARERDAMALKGTPLHYILGKFARSLEYYYLKPGRDISDHPTFPKYAAGYLWETGLPAGGFAYLPSYPPGQLDELKKRFPPKMLKGMSPGATWLPPKEHREAIASLQRSSRSPGILCLPGVRSRAMSFKARLQQEREAITAASTVDPWHLRLERVRGKVDYDGLERVSSQILLDLLEVPQRSRRAGVFRRVAAIMAELGWTPVRVRDLTGRGYKEQVRGYYRDARDRQRFYA